MLRAEFDHLLREAQVGNDVAFVRLWRDANPMLIRYLRVAAVSDPRESARHAWAGVIRDLPSFSGDEIAWRAWILGLARHDVAEAGRRRGRGSASHRPSRGGSHRGSDDRSGVGQVEPAELRGVNDTIAAIRDLPLGQGEILMLRLAGELPVAKVADLVGTDVVAIRRSEDRAVERLGAERELVAWSLAAPALADELADQPLALAAFRGRGGGSAADHAHADHPPVHHLHARDPEAGTPSTAGRSRLAMLGIAAVAASAMSAGALSAAAYVGVLPQGLQQVLHNAIGAPAATAPASRGVSRNDRPSSGPTSGAVAPGAVPTTGAGPALPQASLRRSGAGSPSPHDTASHRSSAAKTPSARPAPSRSRAATPRSTSSASRTPPARPTARATSPARSAATRTHAAQTTVSQRVSPRGPSAGGQVATAVATSAPGP